MPRRAARLAGVPGPWYERGRSVRGRSGGGPVARLFLFVAPEPGSRSRTGRIGQRNLGTVGRDVSRILAIAEPIAAERGLEVLDIEIGGTASNPLVRVLLDSPDADRRVGIDDCQAVSQRVGDALEAYEAVSGRYMLEVSSPGVNKPLKKIEHFRRVLGQKVRVRVKVSGGLRQSFLGRLEAADESAVTVAVEGGEAVRIAFEEIEKANLEYEFENTPGRGTKGKPTGGPSGQKKRR